MIKNFDDPRHRPITMQDILDEERAEQERKQEERERPIRVAQASLNETHRKLYDLEKTEIEAGRPDPSWALPQSARGLNMTVAAAKEFAAREAEAFVAEHPEYFGSRKNFDAITSYLSTQGIVIPTRDCFAQAVERLSHFGLLEERPAPPTEPAPVEQPEPESPAEAPSLVDGWDIQSGEPRQYSQAEIWKMSSADVKKAFRMYATKDEDRRPRFTRSRYQ